ncbi:acyl transferase/acyl hydrolase/lysophospholipase [Limtongia smithiae]|uniref:acyl transferase/acyl hydrolase/lysophospholipase n=1 Tax=Limtongia smithiae TaxID=1125753 RepID=UPI0034CD5ADA
MNIITTAVSTVADRHHLLAFVEQQLGFPFSENADATNNENVSLTNLTRSSISGLASKILHYRRSSFESKANDSCKEPDISQRLAALKESQENANSYDEWVKASRELDTLLGYDEWKSDRVSEDYDYELISERLRTMRELRQSGNYLRLLFFLRTSLSRNAGNIGASQLYSHSHVGTKYLIEDYIIECEESLKAVVDCPIPPTLQSSNESGTYIDDYTKLNELLHTRHAFGRTALLLSGGGTMGMLHSGVLETLIECKLLPKIISGSSAGGIVAAALCTRCDEELGGMLEAFIYFNLDVFEETGNEESVWTRIARLLKHGSWTDISYLEKSMKDMLGDLTFQEAYNRTRRVLNIPVSSASIYEPPRLLNYLTAPNVYIWSAVCASCSVPLIFSAHTLYAKDPRTNEPVFWNPSAQRWIDGSVDNDLPMTRLNEMFNVNHFIVSQVNPHVIPFLKSSDIARNVSLSNSFDVASLGPSSIIRRARRKAAEVGANVLSTSAVASERVMQLALSETMHRLFMSAEVGFFPNLCTKLRSVLAQKYSGDITILPEVYVSELPKILKNPTPQFLMDTRRRGQKATWPRISIIRNHCSVELALDAAIMELRSRTVIEAMVVGARHVMQPHLKQSDLVIPQRRRRRVTIESKEPIPLAEKDGEVEEQVQDPSSECGEYSELQVSAVKESSDSYVDRFVDYDELKVQSQVPAMKSPLSRRSSNSSETYFALYQAASTTASHRRQLSKSQPSTPRPGNSLMRARSSSIKYFTSPGSKSVTTSPQAYSRLLLEPAMTSETPPVLRFTSMALPPSMDDVGPDVLTARWDNSQRYWPLHYDADV